VAAAGAGATSAPSSSPSYTVTPIACLEDNYAYLITTRTDDGKTIGAVIDPVNPDRVLAAVKEKGVDSVVYALTTHHHADHAGGNEEIDHGLAKCQPILPMDLAFSSSACWQRAPRAKGASP